MKTEVVREMALTPKAEVADTSLMAVITRIASDPTSDVDKLERLVMMHERATAKQSEDAFNRAMSLAQVEMRPVEADLYNKQTSSNYASYAALDKALRSIYTKHGFGLSFDTGDAPREQWVRVLCYVSHIEGHTRTYHADMPADGKGAKGGDVMTVTHAVGAAMSYGMRYLLKMIFNVSVGEDDRDGNEPDRDVRDPAGFENIMADLELVATEQGEDALRAAWNKTTNTFRDHIFRNYRRQWEALKAKAAKVTA